jgi:hypothetical protein
MVAGRISASIVPSCRRPKTCTNGDICATTNSNLLDHFVGEVVVGEEKRRRRGRGRATSKKEGTTLKPCMGQILRCLVRSRPRSRIGAYSALAPCTEAFTLALLIALLLLKVLKLAAARITR